MFHQSVPMTSLDADELTRVLADPLRAQMVGLLADEQLCTCHLVEMTGAKQPNVTGHLRRLLDVGVVEAEPAGRYTYYRLRPEVLAALAEHYRDLADRARRATQIRRPCS
jgi:ArsR family transcriptional regulator, arsenate/arsenite/antimonite-responsive transcriptional repressor